MVPSSVQVARVGRRASARSCGGPPEILIRLIFPAATKPIDLLSGDQNGSVASSVPGNSRELVESRPRTQSMVRPLRPATKATVLPSGEMALPPAMPGRSSAPGGGVMESFRGARDTALLSLGRNQPTAIPNAVARAIHNR